MAVLTMAVLTMAVLTMMLTPTAAHERLPSTGASNTTSNTTRASNEECFHPLVILMAPESMTLHGSGREPACGPDQLSAQPSVPPSVQPSGVEGDAEAKAPDAVGIAAYRDAIECIAGRVGCAGR